MFHYINDVLSLNNSKFGDYVDRIYPIGIELEIKDTIDTDRSASYLDWSNIPELVFPIRIFLVECCWQGGCSARGSYWLGWGHYFKRFAVDRCRVSVSQMTADMFHFLWALADPLPIHDLWLDTTGATSVARIACPSWAPDFNPDVWCVSCCSALFCAVCCRSLFVLFHLAIVLSVLRFSDSDYPFGIIKLFLGYWNNQSRHWNTHFRHRNNRMRHWNNRLRHWINQLRYRNKQLRHWKKQLKYWNNQLRYRNNQLRHWNNQLRYWNNQLRYWNNQLRHWNNQFRYCIN